MSSRRPVDLEVRRAEPGDEEYVGLLTERIYQQGGWTNERYSRVLLDGRSRIEDAIVLVATELDAILGTVTVALPGTRFANVCQADEIEVRMLAVDEAARGRGVASRLMEACETLAHDRSSAAVVLSTEPDMHAAHRLYERRGYVRQPARDWSLDGSHFLVYRLPLGS
jgi:ribosomal protein S18 acetylase RimI-like enzyme